MHGAIRTLVNPPVSSKDFAAQEGAKPERELASAMVEVNEAADLIHRPGRLTTTTYDAITLERGVVAVHVVGPADLNNEPARFVLWLDPEDAEKLAGGLLVNARHVRAYNNKR